MSKWYRTGLVDRGLRLENPNTGYFGNQITGTFFFFWFGKIKLLKLEKKAWAMHLITLFQLGNLYYRKNISIKSNLIYHKIKQTREDFSMKRGDFIDVPEKYW